MGHLFSLNKKAAMISELEIGIAGTNAWRTCGFDTRSSFTFFFEIAGGGPTPAQQGQRGVIQFLTHYHNSIGQQVLRVTTVARPYAKILQFLTSLGLLIPLLVCSHLPQTLTKKLQQPLWLGTPFSR